MIDTVSFTPEVLTAPLWAFLWVYLSLKYPTCNCRIAGVPSLASVKDFYFPKTAMDHTALYILPIFFLIHNIMPHKNALRHMGTVTAPPSFTYTPCTCFSCFHCVVPIAVFVTFSVYFSLQQGMPSLHWPKEKDTDQLYDFSKSRWDRGTRPQPFPGMILRHRDSWALTMCWTPRLSAPPVQLNQIQPQPKPRAWELH